MTAATGASATGTRVAARRLGMLLAMAMFVLVVDTSLMNVSIFAVVQDLRMTASGAIGDRDGGRGIRRLCCL